MQKILIIFILISSIGFSQNNTSVLFVGNSYTSFNNLSSLFEDLSISLGKTVFVDSKTNGGYTFQSHANDAVTYQKMNSAEWDYVVLQAQSQEPSFPYAQVNSQTLPYAMRLADSAQTTSECSQALFFMTWGRENGDPQWDSINTFDKMNFRLRNAYLRFADSADASVAPVGVAWKYVRDNHPSISLYTADGSHPKPAGSYLAACAFYASIFHESPVGSTFLGGVDAPTAEILQNAAALAVLDSIDTWKLIHQDSLAQVSFESTLDPVSLSASFEESTSYIDYFEWDFGDGNSSTDSNPTHTYAQFGAYTVQLIGYGPCGNDTVTQSVLFENTTGIEHLQGTTEGYLLKRISEDIYELMTEGQNTLSDFKVLDLLGREIYCTVEAQNEKAIRFQLEQSGPMLLVFDLNKLQQAVRVYH